MSNASVNNTATEYEYWEFVHCAICFLPFIPDPLNAPAAPPVVPFWLTECGHTLCNSHIKADQSCGACGAAGVQLVPLQREMLPPMCDWFRSVPHGLDALASAAKFQQETMTSLVRFYKKKCMQQRATISKIKDAIAENKVLRNQIEQLQQENAQFRDGNGGVGSSMQLDQQQVFTRDHYETRNYDRDRSYESNDSRNANGKRTLSNLQNDQRSSSPHSVTTPIGPQRLILPQDRQKPIYSNIGTAAIRQTPQPHARPGTSTFEQYAYPPATPLRSAPLRHQQQQYQQDSRQEQAQLQQHQPQQRQMKPIETSQKPPQLMLPPPTPVQSSSRLPEQSTHGRAQFRPSGQIQQNVQRKQPPPPPPPSATISRSSSTHATRPYPMPISSSSHGQEQSTTNGRFAVPATPSNRFFTPRLTGLSVGTSRAQGVPGSNAGGSARAPFVPGSG